MSTRNDEPTETFPGRGQRAMLQARRMAALSFRTLFGEQAEAVSDSDSRAAGSVPGEICVVCVVADDQPILIRIAAAAADAEARWWQSLIAAESLRQLPDPALDRARFVPLPRAAVLDSDARGAVASGPAGRVHVIGGLGSWTSLAPLLPLPDEDVSLVVATAPPVEGACSWASSGTAWVLLRAEDGFHRGTVAACDGSGLRLVVQGVGSPPDAGFRFRCRLQRGEHASHLALTDLESGRGFGGAAGWTARLAAAGETILLDAVRVDDPTEELDRPESVAWR